MHSSSPPPHNHRLPTVRFLNIRTVTVLVPSQRVATWRCRLRRSGQRRRLPVLSQTLQCREERAGRAMRLWRADGVVARTSAAIRARMSARLRSLSPTFHASAHLRPGDRQAHGTQGNVTSRPDRATRARSDTRVAPSPTARQPKYVAPQRLPYQLYSSISLRGSTRPLHHVYEWATCTNTSFQRSSLLREYVVPRLSPDSVEPGLSEGVLPPHPLYAKIWGDI